MNNNLEYLQLIQFFTLTSLNDNNSSLVYLAEQFYYQIGMSALTKESECKYKVGEGSFGKVYRYKFQNHNYAIKKIYRDTKNHPELIQKIESEAKIMRRVPQHRNIVRFLGQMTNGKYLYLLTEFIPNGDLRGLNSIKTEEQLWDIVMQVALALNHLRKNKIVHRDIKPQNILVQHQNQLINNQNSESKEPNQIELTLKLADFGLAEIVQPNEYLQGIAGSPIYLAPQICKQEPYSYQVDIWSFGITLYQLINTQKSPYHQEIIQFVSTNESKYTDKQLFKYLTSIIKTKKIKCNSPFPEFNQLVEQMLDKNPKKRPTPQEILNHKKITNRLTQYYKSQIERRKVENQQLEENLSTKYIQQTQNIKQIGNEQNQKTQKKMEPNLDNVTNKNGKMKKEVKQQMKDGLSSISSYQNLQLFLSSRLSNSIIGTLLREDQENQ